MIKLNEIKGPYLINKRLLLHKQSKIIMRYNDDVGLEEVTVKILIALFGSSNEISYNH